MKKLLFIVVSLIFLAGTGLHAQNKYIGAKKCGMCHKKDAKGNQLKKWEDGPHSKAFEQLKSDKAKEFAKAKGIADATTDAKCLACHSTAGAVDKNLHAGIKVEEGVSCESCHGAGSAYKSMTIMKSREKSVAKGLIIPDEKLCKNCHAGANKMHDLKAFDFATASKTIAHPDPSKK